jgi:hypothetical protein
MKHLADLLSLAVVSVSIASPQPVPRELSVLATKARLGSPVAAWCRGEFRAGHAGAYAVAIASPAGGGRYLVLESDATVAVLAAFARKPDLSCYTPEEAQKVNRTIERSLTVHGRIAPRWSTTVVCGFVDDTTSVCWQYSPTDRAFAKVGEWVT